MATLEFTVPIEPMGAPRMTRRDKWDRRPRVVAYWTYRATLQAYAGELPPPDSVSLISIQACFEPPSSWSKKKRAAAIGQLHREKPDIDNIIKGCLDSLWPENDKAIARVEAVKVYGNESQLCVSIERV